MAGEEIFRGLYELCKKIMVSETFGCHPSDQCRAFNYFMFMMVSIIWSSIIYRSVMDYWSDQQSPSRRSLGVSLRIDMWALLIVIASSQIVQVVHHWVNFCED